MLIRIRNLPGNRVKNNLPPVFVSILNINQFNFFKQNLTPPKPLKFLKKKNQFPQNLISSPTKQLETQNPTKSKSKEQVFLDSNLKKSKSTPEKKTEEKKEKKGRGRPKKTQKLEPIVQVIFKNQNFLTISDLIFRTI